MEQEHEKIGLSRGAVRTAGAVAVSLAAVIASVYGGMSWQRHLDSQKPYCLEERGTVCFFIDRANRKEFPAAEITPTYARVDVLSTEIASYKRQITNTKSRLSEISESIAGIQRNLSELVGQ
jgi:hypothetical protein